jgi:phage host-nuclease inhibitor protein Gam
MILNDWADVDRALEKLGRLELGAAEIASEAGRELYDILSRYCAQLAAVQEERGRIESAVTAFCMVRKDEFAKKRSKQLVFGRIAFRVAERIEVPEGLERTVIATLKMLGCEECIETKERLDRNALKKLSDQELARCGVRHAREDHFRIEPNLETVSERMGKSLQAPRFDIDIEKLARSVRPAGERRPEDETRNDTSPKRAALDRGESPQGGCALNISEPKGMF